MGVYIPGLDMPNGGYRTVEIGFDADGHPMAIADGEDVFDVIPAPPHGMIDRTMILDAIRLELASADAVNDMEDYQNWMRVFDYVRKFPTISSAEEED